MAEAGFKQGSDSESEGERGRERERERGVGLRRSRASASLGGRQVGLRMAETRVDAQSYTAGVVLVPQHALEFSFQQSRGVKMEFRSLSSQSFEG